MFFHCLLFLFPSTYKKKLAQYKRRLELHGSALDFKSTKTADSIIFTFIGSNKETVSFRLKVGDHCRGVIVRSMLVQVGKPPLPWHVTAISPSFS